MTKTQVKGTRWNRMEETNALLKQRQDFLEEKSATCYADLGKRMDALSADVKAQIADIKTNDIAHLADAIKGMESSFTTRQDKCEMKIDAMQKIIYKAVGAVGAVLTIVNIILKVWR